MEKTILGKTFSATESDINGFKPQINDTTRNTTFAKVVYDRRNDQNAIIGISDDLVISVYEDDEKFNHWAPALETEDSSLKDILACTKKWSPIKDGTHTVGVRMLKMLLPNLVLEYQEKL